MAKIEVVKITHTYIIRRDGEEAPEIPEPVVNINTSGGGVIVEYEEATEGTLPLPETPPLLARIFRDLGVPS